MKQQKNLWPMMIQGTFWTYLARIASKLIILASAVLLTRLLTEEDFGIAAYALIVINLLTPLNDFGMGTALIYYQEDRDAPHTAFWLGMALSLGLLCLVWICSPLIGMIFHDERAIAVTSFLAFSFPLIALANIHEKLLQKRLSFRQQVAPSLASALGKGMSSVMLAGIGLGAWSLIGGQLIAASLGAIAYWWVFPWRPVWRFSHTAAKTLFSYGRQLISVNLLTSFLHNADYFIIGRILGASMLGLYMVSFRIPELLILEFANVLGRVLFPIYVKGYDNVKGLTRTFLKSLRYVSMIIFPLSIGLATMAQPLVLTLFTDKWIETVPILQAITFYAALKSLDRCSANVFKTLGNLKVLFQITVVRGCLLLPILWWTVTKTNSLVAVGWAQVVIALLNTMALFFFVGRTLLVSFSNIVHALRPAAICSMALGLSVLGMLKLIPTVMPIVQITWAGLVGTLACMTACWLQLDVVKQAKPLLRSVITGE